MAKRLGLATVMVMVMALILVVGGRQSRAADTFNLKFAHIFPGPAKQSLLCEAFVKDLAERSGGRIKTQYFGGGSLLKAPGVYNGVELGVADMGFAHVEYTPGRFPVTEACDLPLGYPSGWVSNMVVNDFYTNFKPKEFDKVKVLWMHACSPNVMITTKPVRTLEDMKGLTIRAPGRVGETVKALGASPPPCRLWKSMMAFQRASSKGLTHLLRPSRHFGSLRLRNMLLQAGRWETFTPFM